MQKFGLDLGVLRSNSERARGYQNASKPATGTGLLFVFNPPDKPSFHMRNVTFPLQITFFDAAWKPLKTTIMQPQTGTAQCTDFCSYVIECNPGDLKATGLTEGQDGGGSGLGGEGISTSPGSPTPAGGFQSHPAPARQKNKTLKVTLKDKIGSLRIGETAQFFPNHGPYLNWSGNDVPLQSEKVPPFNTWWRQPNKYRKIINPRGGQKTDQQNLYANWQEASIGTTMIIEVRQ
jgi:uncharacterized membrane protein (UPF0127 family)